jgi:homoserine kinase
MTEIHRTAIKKSKMKFQENRDRRKTKSSEHTWQNKIITWFIWAVLSTYNQHYYKTHQSLDSSVPWSSILGSQVSRSMSITAVSLISSSTDQPSNTMCWSVFFLLAVIASPLQLKIQIEEQLKLLQISAGLNW